MLPTGPNGLRFYRPARVFSELPPHEVGCGTWNAWRDSADLKSRGARTTWTPERQSHHDRGAYETPLVLNLPAEEEEGNRAAGGGRADFEMVDRHGFAPCSLACEASDLLNDRAAQMKTGGGGGNRTRSLTAYEAAAFPPGSPAI